MGEYTDIRIHGAERKPGGRYGVVEISGSGKFDGSVECDSFRLSGAGEVENGGLTVHGPLSCSGAGKIGGPVTADSLNASGALTVKAEALVSGPVQVSGSIKVEGNLRADALTVSGICTLEGSAAATGMEIGGILRTPGDVQAEVFRSTGCLEIGGLLNAETVEIQLAGENRVASIGGGTVRVVKRDAGFRFFRKRPCLNATLIEADEITLEYTDAETVRGVNVHIGPECVIDRVEYSGSLTTDANCTVREKVKV